MEQVEQGITRGARGVVITRQHNSVWQAGIYKLALKLDRFDSCVRRTRPAAEDQNRKETTLTILLGVWFMMILPSKIDTDDTYQR